MRAVAIARIEYLLVRLLVGQLVGYNHVGWHIDYRLNYSASGYRTRRAIILVAQGGVVQISQLQIDDGWSMY